MIDTYTVLVDFATPTEREIGHEFVDGEFEFTTPGDALGPQLSVLCSDWMTHLSHVPCQHLTA